MKSLEDKVLKLTHVSRNIEVVLLSVGVVYGGEESHLLPLFKKAFDNKELKYQVLNSFDRLDDSCNSRSDSQSGGSRVGSKSQTGSGPSVFGSSVKNKKNFKKNKSKEDVKVETILNQKNNIEHPETKNQSYPNPTQSTFPITTTQTPKTKSQLPLINARIISQTVTKLSEQPLPDFQEEGPPNSSQSNISGLLNSTDLGKNPLGTIAFRYSRKYAKMFFSYKRGDLLEKRKTDNFNVEEIEEKEGSESSKDVMQSESQDSESIKRGLIGARDALANESDNKDSNLISGQNAQENENINNNENTNKVNDNTKKSVLAEKGMINEKLKQYFEYIEEIIGNQNNFILFFK